MTLRSRLILIFSLASLLVLAMGAVLVASQYTFAVGQVDRQISSVEKQAVKVVKYVDAGGVLPTADDGSSSQSSGGNTSQPTATPSASSDVIPAPTKTKGKNSGAQKTPGQNKGKNKGQDSGQNNSSSQSITKQQTQTPIVNAKEATKPPLVPDVFVGIQLSPTEITPYAYQVDSTQRPASIEAEAPTPQNPRFLTVATADSSGQTGTMRVGLFIQEQKILVVGISLDGVTAGSIQLATNAFIAWLIITAALFIAYLWVNRLGLRPIRKITDVAQLINEGDKTQRAPEFPSKTEAQDLGIAVNELLDENQRVENKLRQFVSDAAHELRTPLTAITGYSSLYAKGSLTTKADISDAMRRINDESSRMTRLVNDLLLLTTIDQKAEPATSAVDVIPLIEDVLSDMRVIDSQRDFVLSGAEKAPALVSSDLFTQLLVILLTNAQEHGPANTPINVSVATDQNVRVSVRDEGPGIPVAQQARIFERFARVNDSRVTGKGTGLGLAIAKAIVEKIGGSIRVTSQTASSGETFTSFTVELPTS